MLSACTCKHPQKYTQTPHYLFIYKPLTFPPSLPKLPPSPMSPHPFSHPAPNHHPFCSIHYARACARIMRADTWAHTYIKFVTFRASHPIAKTGTAKCSRLFPFLQQPSSVLFVSQVQPHVIYVMQYACTHPSKRSERIGPRPLTCCSHCQRVQQTNNQSQ